VGPFKFKKLLRISTPTNVDKQYSSTVQSETICWYEVQFKVICVLCELHTYVVLCFLFYESLSYKTLQYHNSVIIHISLHTLRTLIHKTPSLYIIGMY
jgi:hypothetical protein